jgi:uncharacterized protein DUF4159
VRRARRLALVLLLGAAVLPLSADSLPPQVHYENVPYNGRFTFLRLRFDPTYWRPGNYMWGLDLSWNHDYPRGENHFIKILSEVTSIEVNTAGNILALDDPELFKYPIAYVCEVGQWQMSEREVRALHDYLLKGGFLIVDDFAGRDLDVFEYELAKALPEARLIELDVSHQVFDSFFRIQSLPAHHPYRRGAVSHYYGIFEDNDPKKRMMVMLNYNNDISEYWEFSDEGFAPIDLTNDAYKLGVNYVVYAMTH